MTRKRYSEWGYTIGDISTALQKLGCGLESSANKLRVYAKANSLLVERKTISPGPQRKYSVVPESKLEDLINGMDMPVRVNELIAELESSRKFHNKQ